MGLFDSLVKKAQDAVAAKTEELTKKRVTAPKQSILAKKIISRFYADYPETPFISNDRPDDWIESAELFPKQCIIPKEIMKRYSDGLLPGHIYMLYWLKKYTNKKIPSYFEYKYGVNFEKEKDFLYKGGYLDDMSKPTKKGEDAIQKHYAVVENHTQPKSKLTIEDISRQTIAQRDSMIRNGFKEYTFISNKDCCEICAALNGKHFKVSKLNIGVNAPPMHEGCKCSISAYENDAEYEAWLNSL